MTALPIDRWRKEVARYDRPHLRLRQVALLVHSLNPASILDIGCGRGQLMPLCPDVDYVGCDLVAPETDRDFPFVQFDVNAPSLPHALSGGASKFDVVVCSGMLEYVDDLPRFIVWLRECVADDGRLIVTYFNFNYIHRRVRHLFKMPVSNHPDWKNALPCKRLVEELNRGGFGMNRIIPTHHSWRPSPGIEATETIPCRLRTLRAWSPWFAHQFIIVSSKRPCDGSQHSSPHSNSGS